MYKPPSFYKWFENELIVATGKGEPAVVMSKYGFKIAISLDEYASYFDNIDPLSPYKKKLGGVLFKGNLRGQAAVTYKKVEKRLQETFGDQYKLFLLLNPEDDKPVAVVIGSFGAITRILNIVPNREDLLKIAIAGPLAGFSLGFVLLLLGFYLPPADGIWVIVDASVFHESLLAGGIGTI
ncbi:hypothetical protein L1887_32645 [Cichorium endivia]|nr:hypothetical protein L1887_32645 [Cichorium endivia]